MFYLIAERLGHSCSRELHAHFGDYEYEYKELAPDEVGDFMQGGDWEGLNVTIPYKTEVMKYLDEISPEAQAIGSVNTIVRRDGRKIGYNTDYYGFFAASNKAGILFGGRKVVILGTGGTSKTAQKVAADCGAAEIVVVSRTGENNYENISRHADADILVNTTPVGMYPKTNEKPISLSIFRNLTGVIDVIYNPLYTNLILEAQAAGIKNIGGLYMLTVQAAMASAFFTGVKPDRDAINGAYASLLRSRRNIVLVGMPGSGKSSIAAELGARLGRRVLDTDAVIVERAGMPIPEIFEKYGEAHFRALERSAIEECSAEHGVIISCGGGAVLDRNNLPPLIRGGRIYLVLRELDRLARDGRPLSAGADLTEMYRQRLPHYLAFSDASIENNSTIDAAVDKILEDFNENFDSKRPKS